jgi:hypothetical protein
MVVAGSGVPGPAGTPRADHDGRDPAITAADAAIMADLVEGDDQPEPAAEPRCRAEFAVEPAEEASPAATLPLCR